MIAKSCKKHFVYSNEICLILTSLISITSVVFTPYIATTGDFHNFYDSLTDLAPITCSNFSFLLFGSLPYMARRLDTKKIRAEVFVEL